MCAEATPFYFIYGERARDVDPRFVHVERVRDRDQLHGGRVRRHSHPHLHQLAFWFGGRASYAAADEGFRLEREALTWIPAGVAHAFEMEPGCNAIVVSMSVDFLRESLGGLEVDGVRQVLRRPLVAALDPRLAGQVRGHFEEIEREYGYPSWAQGHMIAAYVRLLFITVTRLAQVQLGAVAEETLVTRFLGLVDERFRERQTIEAYAATLGATPYLLNRATREGLGMSPSAVVRDRALQEAKRLLLYTMLDVGEVAFALGFQDAAHFGRLFRREVGEAPARWRNRQRQALAAAAIPVRR